MNKRIHIVLLMVLMALLPSLGMSGNVVKGTATLGNNVIEAEYTLNGATAQLGSGYNACVSQYSVGSLVVPSTITVGGTTYPVTSVAPLAFRMCTQLTCVTLPEGVTRVGDFAFVGCRAMQELVLPSTLTTIGSGAFIDLPNLQNVVIYAHTPTVWEYNDVFCFHNGGIGDSQAYHTNQVTLIVPSGTVKTYRNASFTNASLGWTTADGWGYFNNIIPNTEYVFVNTGNWNASGNWRLGTVPAEGEDVYITADVTIPNGFMASVDAIDVADGATITIADGGQFVTNMAVEAIVEKQVAAAPDWMGSKDGWRLIASPLEGSTGYTAAASNYVENLVVDNYNGIADGEFHYDFYGWDGSEELEWRNYRDASPKFNMENGLGYLYASRENRHLTFNGTVKANNDDEVFETQYGEGEFGDFSLFGNPFACNAYLVGEEGSPLAFYVMNESGSGLVVSEGPIAPMQGFFVAATAANQSFTVSRNAPAVKSSSLSMSLVQGSSRVDNAMLRFGKGSSLPKMSFRKEGSKVYVPLEGRDFAVVNAEAMGEMPLCFKAAKDGDYTLCFKTENMSFEYLHLIDNITGVDVDLLATPTYGFKAKTTDYASRFRLVFQAESVSGESDADAFAFVNNGNIIVSGEGFLQVMDMMGRALVFGGMMKCESDSVNRISTNGMTPGVYVLRLVSGETVKTQKIVVK